MFPTFFSDDESSDVTMDDVVGDSAVDDSLDLTSLMIPQHFIDSREEIRS
jgi:hypothetical protein